MKMTEASKDFSTLSISGMLSKTKEVSGGEEQVANSDLREPFNERELKEIWQVLAMEYYKKINFYSTLTKYGVTLEGDSIVKLEVDNKTQLNEFRDARSTILLKLRKALKNFGVEIEVFLSKDDSGKQVYTATEKFDYLKKKQPLLDKLKKELDLEIRI
jgi:DNA polymerase III subunit gamma/tau